jgi:peptide/nickel transport system substrate-binding protein
MRVRTVKAAVVLAGVLAMLGAACNSSSPGGGGASGPGTTGTPSSTPVQGGSIVVGAEQWPECVNPITSCSSASWLFWSVLNYVMPRAMELDLEGNFIASPVLTEAPTLENGGLTQNPFTVTFNINPDANWADGSPITSADFDFTWRAIMNTSGAFTTTGYDLITKVDTTDPKKAVVTFKSVYVDWPDLFGGAFQGFFEKAAFPKFANNPKPNLKDEMLDNIPFSGNAFKLDSWSQDQAVLTRNDNYFGQKAYLDQVTMVPRLDQSTEINSLLTGEIDAIFPQPSDVSLLDQVSTNPNVKAIGDNGVNFEALWFNHSAAPLDDAKVREALMYAIDRQAVVDNIIKLNNPNAEVLNCGFISFPNIGPWCQQDPLPFAGFTFDPAKARSLLEADGYDCSSQGQPCTKDGDKLTVQYTTVSTNTRRTTTQELLKESALQAGFDFSIKNYDAGVLFGDVGPRGKFVMADYASGGSPDPSVTATFSCNVIPTQANNFGGGNWNRWCNPQADQLMKDSDQELDQTKREDLMDQFYQLQAQDAMSLPLYVLPNVSAWRTDKIAGPIGTWNPTIYGLFWNMNEWYVASR